jgi:hypothetical protein
MLKTVASASLRPGMFLHSLDRRWLDHPFWKSSFLLTEIDIEKIVASGITSIVIDTEKGLGYTGDAVTGQPDSFDAGGVAAQDEDGQLLAATRTHAPRRPIGEEI